MCSWRFLSSVVQMIRDVLSTSESIKDLCWYLQVGWDFINSTNSGFIVGLMMDTLANGELAKIEFIFSNATLPPPTNKYLFDRAWWRWDIYHWYSFFMFVFCVFWFKFYWFYQYPGDDWLIVGRSIDIHISQWRLEAASKLSIDHAYISELIFDPFVIGVWFVIFRADANAPIFI